MKMENRKLKIMHFVCKKRFFQEKSACAFAYMQKKTYLCRLICILDKYATISTYR